MKIIAKVVSQKGTCQAGHRVGDEFVIGQTTPEGMCSWAFSAVFPYAEALEFGGSFPGKAAPIRPAWPAPTPIIRSSSS